MRPVMPADPVMLTRAFEGDVFQAARDALLYLGWDIQFEDESRGILKTNSQKVVMDTDLNADGGSWNGRAIHGTASCTAEVRIKGQVAAVTCSYVVEMKGWNGQGNVTRQETYPCLSLGTRENLILSEIEKMCSTDIEGSP